MVRPGEMKSFGASTRGYGAVLGLLTIVWALSVYDFFLNDCQWNDPVLLLTGGCVLAVLFCLYHMLEPQRTSLGARVWPVLVLWTVFLAWLACLTGSAREVIRAVPLFFVGWTFAVPFLARRVGWSSWLLPCVSWVLPVGLTAGLILVRRRSAYLCLYMVLCLLFVLNLVGCNELQHLNFKQ